MRRVCRLLFRGAPMLLLLALPGCLGVLDPHGPIAAAERLILFNSLAIMLAIVVPTIALAMSFAWWYRASNARARRRPDFVYSGRLELVIWFAPIMIILFLGGLIWIGSHELDPGQPIASKRPALPVQVVSLDWKWLFIYPEQKLASVNQLTVPVGTPVHFQLTSSSVMNSFFVPQLGGMIATMAGMITTIHLQADQPGDYFGLSTQFSGDGFSGMHFILHAVPQDAFNTWVTQTQANGPTLDRAAYEKLEQQSINVKPYTYRAADPALFEDIATMRIPPGPGPRNDQGVPGVRPKAG